MARFMDELSDDPLGRISVGGAEHDVWVWETHPRRPMVVVRQPGPRRYEVIEVVAGRVARATVPLVQRFRVISALEASRHEKMRALHALR